MRDKFMLWLARRIPRSIRYWCVIVAGAEASSGKYSDQIVPDMLYMDVLKRIE